MNYSQTFKVGQSHELSLLVSDRFITYKGVTLPSYRKISNPTTTIDNIIITDKYIIIAEAKNITGEVDVDLHIKKPKITNGSRVVGHKINPIHQNSMHARVLLSDLANNNISTELEIKPIVVYHDKVRMNRPDYLKGLVMNKTEFNRFMSEQEPLQSGREHKLLDYLFRGAL